MLHLLWTTAGGKDARREPVSTLFKSPPEGFIHVNKSQGIRILVNGLLPIKKK